MSIYVETVPLDPTKVLRSVTLPDDGRLKVSAMTVLQARLTGDRGGEKVRGKFAEVVAHRLTRRYK